MYMFYHGPGEFCSMLVGLMILYFLSPAINLSSVASVSFTYTAHFVPFIRFVIVSLSWGSFTPCVCANLREMYCYAFTAGGNEGA